MVNSSSESGDHKYKYLEGVVQAGLSEIGVSKARIQFISDTGNLIFRADRQAQSFAIRVYKDYDVSNSYINAELFWLLDIKQKTNLSVPEPISDKSANLIQEITHPTVEKPVKLVIFDWLPGDIIGSQLNLGSASHMGEKMAALHLHASHFQLPENCFRDENDWRGMGHFKAGLSEIEIQRIDRFMRNDQIDICEMAAGIATKNIEKVDIQHDFGLIHSDFHANNVILHHGKFSIIDFDDCQFAPFNNDLAITLVSFDQSPKPELLQEAFLQGYSKVRSLPKNFEQELEAFMMERRLRLLRWIATWPSENYFPFGKALIEKSMHHLEKYTHEMS
ncbi:MAG TPA: phosphotransferase [Anaerolineaceae bacterium]|nr:phosphotransferase [Anaerolineaceae bacterium]